MRKYLLAALAALTLAAAFATPAKADCQVVCYTDSSGRTVCHQECHHWGF